MNRVILVSWHYFNSKRKAGFHWLADAFWKMGWDVVFVTAPISLVSWLCKDSRFQYPIFKEANKLVNVKEHLWSYVLLTLWHPTNIKNIDFLNCLATPLYKRYSKVRLNALEDIIKTASLIIFESTAALLLFNRFKEINSEARYIYRVSDDLHAINSHPLVIETENHIANNFDIISTPSKYIYDKLSRFPSTLLQHHGIRKDLFDKNYSNPYKRGINAVFVGNSHFDYNFIEHASKLFPDWYFHIIGPIPDLPTRKNIVTYGEMPFHETISYIKYADIGLQTLSYTSGSESLTDSLKVIQYTYCRLPIVAPAFLKTDRKHVFYYEHDNPKSIKQALLDAYSFDHSKVIISNIYSWGELAMTLTKGCSPNNNQIFM